MYAIVELGGKQYKVEKGLTINVDKLKGQEPGILICDKVLLLSDGDKIIVGKPYLSNVQVSLDVIGTVKGKKVRGIKFKKRKNYTRTLGHRPLYLQMKVKDLTVS
jgi:large subunit ribosomal protein L21